MRGHDVNSSVDQPARSGTANLDLGDIEIVSQVEPGGDGHRGLDARTTHLAVTLGSMTVTDGEQCAGYQDGQKCGGAGHEVLGVDVPGVRAWREGVQPTRFGWGDTDNSREWVGRDFNATDREAASPTV